MSKHVLTDDEARQLLQIGATPRDLVRLRWPDASDKEADHVLWEQTPFPLIREVHDLADAVADIDDSC
jgi:hypothetical protein